MSQIKPNATVSEQTSMDRVEVDDSSVLEKDRRAALKKIGRFTIYMAPVMLGLVSQKAAAGS